MATCTQYILWVLTIVLFCLAFMDECLVTSDLSPYLPGHSFLICKKQAVVSVLPPPSYNFNSRTLSSNENVPASPEMLWIDREALPSQASPPSNQIIPWGTCEESAWEPLDQMVTKIDSGAKWTPNWCQKNIKQWSIKKSKRIWLLNVLCSVFSTFDFLIKYFASVST